MHIENELVEYVSPVDQEYEEIVEEYEEEALISEEFPEPPVTDITDVAPTQGKSRCMALILLIDIYICYAFTLQELYGNYMTPMSFTSAGSRSALLRFIGSVSNLSLLTIGGYYYYNSHDKMMERKIGDRVGIWYGYWWV
jgi:hypothetical protein